MIDGMYAEIGAAIRRRRGELGMTQAALASYLGLSRTSVTNIECGRQPMLVHQLFHISRVLGVEVEDFLRIGTPAEADNIENVVPTEFKALFARLTHSKRL